MKPQIGFQIGCLRILLTLVKTAAVSMEGNFHNLGRYVDSQSKVGKNDVSVSSFLLCFQTCLVT